VESIEMHRAQAKQVFKKLNDKSPLRLAIEAGAQYYYAYVLRGDVCVLAVCERSYPKKLAFDFAAELLKEFETSYAGADVRAATRPYSFIAFEKFIARTQRLYADTRSQMAIEKVAEELRDAQRVMTQNIQDILDRGEKISAVATRSEQLVSETSRYHKQARSFERMVWWRQKMPFIVVIVLVILLLFVRFVLF
jgi:vesicle transport protein SEC22